MVVCNSGERANPESRVVVVAMGHERMRCIASACVQQVSHSFKGQRIRARAWKGNRLADETAPTHLLRHMIKEDAEDASDAALR